MPSRRQTQENGIIKYFLGPSLQDLDSSFQTSSVNRYAVASKYLCTEYPVLYRSKYVQLHTFVKPLMQSRQKSRRQLGRKRLATLETSSPPRDIFSTDELASIRLADILSSGVFNTKLRLNTGVNILFESTRPARK